MLKIEFTDYANWTKENGEIFTPTGEFYIDGKMVSMYIPPVITEDSFNGSTYPVQINQWEGYTIKTASKELGIHFLAKLKSCSYIKVTDIETNDSIIVDTKSNDGITIEAGNRFMTNNQSFTINVKGEKIKTYPIINDTYIPATLRVLSKLGVTTNFSIKKIPLLSYSESTRSEYDDSSGKIYTAKTTSKTFYKSVFYLMYSDAMNLKLQIENINYSSISLIYGGYTYPIIETPVCKVTELVEGLVRLDIDLVTVNNVNYA